MKIIQLTDIHLFKDKDEQLLGLSTYQYFRQIILHIEQYHMDLDMIFLTGDISQDETKESYQNALALLALLNKPVYWIPGNHDDMQYLTEVFGQHPHFFQVPYLKSYGWDFIFLNTQKVSSTFGFLNHCQLELLTQYLQQISNEKKVAVVMHHPPLAVGTSLVDSSILQNGHQFWQTVQNKIHLVIAGHVHHDYSLRSESNIAIETGPATCFQFKKGTDIFEPELKWGYKIFYFTQHRYEMRCQWVN